MVNVAPIVAVLFTVGLTLCQGQSYQNYRTYYGSLSPKTINTLMKVNTYDVFKYHSYGDMLNYLNLLAVRYPGVVQVITIGFSTENRPLRLVKIGRPNKEGVVRPTVWIDAGFHAREWIAPATAMYIIRQLAEEPLNSPMYDGVDWYILPVANPDGYEFSRTKDRLWRKTRAFNEGSTCRGVDPNRNFDFHFNEIGASSDPCAETYHGGTPFSIPETAAVSNFILANSDRIVIGLTFHSYGSTFLYPWGYTTEIPSDWRSLDGLAVLANAAQVRAGGVNYTVGPVSGFGAQYLGSGGSDDWMKGVAGIQYSYTVELYGGAFGFKLPETQISPVVKPMFEAVRVFGKYAKYIPLPLPPLPPV